MAILTPFATTVYYIFENFFTKILVFKFKGFMHLKCVRATRREEFNKNKVYLSGRNTDIYFSITLTMYFNEIFNINQHNLCKIKRKNIMRNDASVVHLLKFK